jgi:hypothetical protein
MLTLLSLLSISQAKEIGISNIDVSSYRAPQDGSKYDSSQLFDGKSTTAWIEDDEGSGLGSWFEVTLKESASISSLQFWNGYWYSFNQWDYHNRVGKLEVSFEDGSKEVFELKNDKKVEKITFAKPHSGSSFKVRFAKVHSGSAYADRTAVSEIKVFDSSDEDYVKAIVKASSTLPEDNDGSYNSENLQDKLKDTPWCEGADGSGEGATLTYEFGSSQKVSSAEIVNGNGTDFKLFMAYGSVTSAELEFDNGSTQVISIKPSLMPQTITFNPVNTKKIVAKIVSSKKGGKVDDTCISELRFR